MRIRRFKKYLFPSLPQYNCMELLVKMCSFVPPRPSHNHWLSAQSSGKRIITGGRGPVYIPHFTSLQGCIPCTQLAHQYSYLPFRFVSCCRLYVVIRTYEADNISQSKESPDTNWIARQFLLTSSYMSGPLCLLWTRLKSKCSYILFYSLFYILSCLFWLSK